MIIYGMKIISDISFDFKLPSNGEYKDNINLSSKIPLSIKNKLTCGSYLHTTHEHKIYLYTNQDISKDFYKNQPFCYEVDGLIKFYWYHKNKTIYYEFINATKEQFEFWFIHPFFSFFLTIEEYFVLLHGSAIEINGKSILFLAPYKSGKSTLTNYIAKKGHKLITDDILPTFIKEDTIYYAPAHPYSRLSRKPEVLGEFISNYKYNFETIDRVYIIQNNKTTTHSITLLQGIEKFKMVRQNSVIYSLPNIRIKHEKYLGTFLNKINFFLLNRPWGKEYIPKTYKYIINHINETSEDSHI